MKNFEITYRDGRVRYLAADEARTHGGRTVFYQGGRIVAVVQLSDVGILNELGHVNPPRRVPFDPHPDRSTEGAI